MNTLLSLPKNVILFTIEVTKASFKPIISFDKHNVIKFFKIALSLIIAGVGLKSLFVYLTRANDLNLILVIVSIITLFSIMNLFAGILKLQPWPRFIFYWFFIIIFELYISNNSYLAGLLSHEVIDSVSNTSMFIIAIYGFIVAYRTTNTVSLNYKKWYSKKYDTWIYVAFYKTEDKGYPKTGTRIKYYRYPRSIVENREWILEYVKAKLQIENPKSEVWFSKDYFTPQKIVSYT